MKYGTFDVEYVVECNDDTLLPTAQELTNGVREALPKEWLSPTDGDGYWLASVSTQSKTDFGKAMRTQLTRLQAELDQEKKLTAHLDDQISELSAHNSALEDTVSGLECHASNLEEDQRTIKNLQEKNDNQRGIIGKQNARMEENDTLKAQNRTLTTIAQNNGVYINEARAELDEARAEIAGLENELIERRSGYSNLLRDYTRQKDLLKSLKSRINNFDGLTMRQRERIAFLEDPANTGE